MRILTLFVATGIVAVMGCGGKGGDGGGADGDEATGGDDVERFTLACMAHSNLSRSLCECSGRKAEDQLSDDGFALLIAILERDEPRAADLRGKLGVSEVMAAGTFMTRGPAECAAELVSDSAR